VLHKSGARSELPILRGPGISRWRIRGLWPSAILGSVAYTLSTEAPSFYPEVGGSRIFRKYGAYLPRYVATHGIQEYHRDLCSQVQWLSRMVGATRGTVSIVGGDLSVH